MAASAKTDFAFTHYIRSTHLDGEPEPEAFDAAWEKLRRILRSELRRRSLASNPPTFLGIYGYSSWNQPEPLEELMVDCFTWVFVERLASLAAALEALTHIETLALRYIRNFLYDRQKRHDPLGFRIFEVLRGAMERLVQAGALHVLDGDPRIRNPTILGIARDTDPREADNAAVADHVATWSDDLLPGLVTATPRQLEPVIAALCDHVATLAGQVPALRFGEIIGALKTDVRRRWGAIYREDAGDTSASGDGREIVRSVRPEPGYEERQGFEALVECVEESLPKLARTRKTLGHLQRLWSFVRSLVAERDEDRLPSNRRLAKTLDVPRKRIPELLKYLRALVEECRGSDPALR